MHQFIQSRAHWLAGIGLAVIAAPAMAATFNIGDDGVTLRVDTTVSAGIAIRVEDQDPALIGQANTTADGTPGRAFSTNNDDGNLHVDKGDIYAVPFKALTEFNLSGRTLGLFGRVSYLIDGVLKDDNFFDPADYAGATGSPPRTSGPATLAGKRDAVNDHVGNDGDVLDLYLYADFDAFGRYVSVRIGNQVLNWGESTFVLNGLNSIVSLDAAQVRVPGFLTEEIFRPVPMAWTSIGLTDNITVEGFYQWGWKATLPDPSGTFLSSNDFAAIGGTSAQLGFGRAPENSAPGTICSDGSPCVPFGAAIPRDADREPDDGDQYGGALRFFVPWLNDADVSLYGANYHSRLPLFSGRGRPTLLSTAADASYFVVYPEDIKLYGMSFNTSIFWDIALQGEVSVKQDQPLQIDDVELLLAGLGQPSQVAPAQASVLGREIVGFRRHDVTQVDIGLTKIFGPWNWLGSDQQLFLLELAGMQISDFPDSDELRYEGPGTYLPGDALTAAALGVPQQTEGYPTDTSWGYILAMRLTYNNVFNRFVVEPFARWTHDVDGISPTPLTNFVEDRKQLNLGFTARYLNALEVGMTYTQYSGGGLQNLISDRDHVQAFVRYSF